MYRVNVIFTFRTTYSLTTPLNINHIVTKFRCDDIQKYINIKEGRQTQPNVERFI